MRPFVVDLGWTVLLDRLGIPPADLLRAAELPADLFQRERPTVDADGFLRLWAALTHFLRHPAPGLLLGRAVQADTFNPPLFAAFCSPNLAVALDRLSLFKPLFGPLKLRVSQRSETLVVEFGTEDGLRLPKEYVAAELVFLLSLARMATQRHVLPVQVGMTDPPTDDAYVSFFGQPVAHAATNRLVFSNEAAALPFYSVNPAMFSIFEPELRTRLDELTRDVALTDRLRAALMEALPSGQTDIAALSKRLGLSPRSLQRRLGEAQTSYKAELTNLRSRLAVEYLRTTAHSSAEISYLLGYEDPNSFIRAFKVWTGTSPEAMRAGSVQ
jgi:AraC-like DNA-binding protein